MDIEVGGPGASILLSSENMQRVKQQVPSCGWLLERPGRLREREDRAWGSDDVMSVAAIFCMRSTVKATISPAYVFSCVWRSSPAVLSFDMSSKSLTNSFNSIAFSECI